MPAIFTKLYENHIVHMADLDSLLHTPYSLISPFILHWRCLITDVILNWLFRWIGGCRDGGCLVHRSYLWRSYPVSCLPQSRDVHPFTKSTNLSNPQIFSQTQTLTFLSPPANMVDQSPPLRWVTLSASFLTGFLICLDTMLYLSWVQLRFMSFT